MISEKKILKNKIITENLFNKFLFESFDIEKNLIKFKFNNIKVDIVTEEKYIDNVELLCDIVAFKGISYFKVTEVNSLGKVMSETKFKK